jgi:predicted secreted hydrolase
VGWDWFSLQLSDGRELMFFQLRRRDGTPDTLGHGALVAPDGGWEVLSAGEVEVGVLDRWESPLDGTAYPSGWRIRLPGHGVDLTAMSDETHGLASRRLHAKQLALDNVVEISDGMELRARAIGHMLSG